MLIYVVIIVVVWEQISSMVLCHPSLAIAGSCRKCEFFYFSTVIEIIIYELVYVITAIEIIIYELQEIQHFL